MKPSKQVVDMMEMSFEDRVERLRDEMETEAVMAKQIRTSKELQFRDAMHYAVMERVLAVVRLLKVRSYEEARNLCAFTDATDTDSQE